MPNFVKGKSLQKTERIVAGCTLAELQASFAPTVLASPGKGARVWGQKRQITWRLPNQNQEQRRRGGHAMEKAGTRDIAKGTRRSSRKTCWQGLHRIAARPGNASFPSTSIRKSLCYPASFWTRL